MILGAHVSVSGNINKAIETALKYNFQVIQIFSSPPRNWNGPKATKPEVEQFVKDKTKLGLEVFIHAKYLVNLASLEQQTVNKSIQSLVEDLEFAKKISARGVIFHPHPKDKEQLRKNLATVLERTPGGAWIILENSAINTLEEIGQIIDEMKSPRVKFCLDTAHAYEAGYDINTENGLVDLLKLIRERIGIENWVVVHANNSKTKINSHHDQHANIEEGEINTRVFEYFINNQAAEKLPFILETPELKDLQKEIRSMEVLRRLEKRK